MEGTKMLGRPRVVDEESLQVLEGPVRMLFHSQAPDRLPKFIMLLANLQGFKIGVSIEFAKAAAPMPSAPEEKEDDDRRDDNDGRDFTKTRASQTVTRRGSQPKIR
jgi:hypothetical protein